MNGVQVFILFLTLSIPPAVIIRALNQRYGLWRKLFYAPPNMQFKTAPAHSRIFIGVKYDNPEIVKIKSRILDSGKAGLVRDLCIVNKNHFKDDYSNMNYDQVLSTITPEEAKLIEEMRGFLK